MTDDTQFELNARIFALTRQRDDALSQCVDHSARLALAGRKIGELEKQIRELQQTINDMRPDPCPD